MLFCKILTVYRTNLKEKQGFLTDRWNLKATFKRCKPVRSIHLWGKGGNNKKGNKSAAEQNEPILQIVYIDLDANWTAVLNNPPSVLLKKLSDTVGKSCAHWLCSSFSVQSGRGVTSIK